MVAASATAKRKIVDSVWNQLLLLISLAKGFVANMSSLPANMVVFYNWLLTCFHRRCVHNQFSG